MSPPRKAAYSYPMLPVLVAQLRETPYYAPIDLPNYVSSALEELAQKETRLEARRRDLRLLALSLRDRKFLLSCIDQEERSLVHAHQAVLHFQKFLSSRNPLHLTESLIDYTTAESHIEQVLKLRKNTPLYSLVPMRAA